MIDLRPACAALGGVLAGVTTEQLTAPTPCSEYTVSDLVDHLDEVSQGFAALARKDTGEPTSTDDLALVAEHVTALGEAWAEPSAWQGSTDAGGGLELANEVWGRIALTEVVVHGWDLATATGQPFDVPEQTLRACLAHVTEFVPNAPVPELWGPAVAVPPDAPLLERIVATTGRTP